MVPMDYKESLMIPELKPLTALPSRSLYKSFSLNVRKLWRQHAHQVVLATSQNTHIQIKEAHHPEYLESSRASSTSALALLPERPSFDFSSFYQNPEKIKTHHEALETLISGHNLARPLSEKEMWLRRTLRERREVVRALLMESLRRIKMGPTYCTTVVNCMPEFVDHVLIEAAALKKDPEHIHAPFSYRARLYIEQSGVAKTIRWLRDNRFTPGKIGRLVFLVEDHEGNLRPKIQWLKSIHIHGKELGAGLLREPRILQQTIAELNEKVELLKTAGIRVDWVGWVVRRCPKVLACSKEELQERIALLSDLGISKDELGRMAYNFPACLAGFTLDDMHSKLAYLRGFGLDDATLARILVSKPQLIARSVEGDWKPLVKLLYFLGIDGLGMRRILIVQPSVFCMNLHLNIAPKIRFLRDVGVPEETIGDVLVKFPKYLSYSTDRKIKPFILVSLYHMAFTDYPHVYGDVIDTLAVFKVSLQQIWQFSTQVMFLIEVAGVPMTKVGKVLSQQPDLMGCNVAKKLETTVKFFLYHHMQREDVAQMVIDFPLVLKYSLSVLKPKLKYILKDMKLPLKEVISFPRVFSYSLETKIAPRHRILEERGLSRSLKAMLACTDEEFMKRLESDQAGNVDEYSDASWSDIFDDAEGTSELSCSEDELDLEISSQAMWETGNSDASDVERSG